MAQLQPDLAGKITGMLLEMDNSDVLLLLKPAEALRSKVEEAVGVLKHHNAIPTGVVVRDCGKAPPLASPSPADTTERGGTEQPAVQAQQATELAQGALPRSAVVLWSAASCARQL